LTVYCLLPYGTAAAERVPNEIGQRPAMLGASGDEDLTKDAREKCLGNFGLPGRRTLGPSVARAKSKKSQEE